jgi:serine/threonine protein kinase
MELVAGQSLARILAQRGRLEAGEAVALALEVLSALEAAHERGVVHRDVKPQNVLLAEEGRAKVTDFGIARARDTEGLTITGTIMGTSDYIPPEQAQGEPVGAPGDVYSLGVVLFELLTGDVPYEAENPVAVAMRHVHDPIPSVRERRPDVPPRVDAVVQRALAKDPRDRFPTMGDLIAELEQCRRGEPPPGDATMIIPPRRPPSRARGRSALRTTLLVLVALLLIAGAAIGAYVLTQSVTSSGGSGGANETTTPVALTAAGAFDPYGTGGEHDADAPKAVDGDGTTYWRTESYNDGLNKDGVGLVLDAGTARRISSLTVRTDTPGFTAEIQDGDSPTGPFTTVSPSQTTGALTTFSLRDARARYYVVWITDLGGLHVAHVNEVRALG